MERAAEIAAAGGQAVADDYLAEFAAADRRALAELKRAWGEAYEIGCYEGGGGWWWRRRDQTGGVEKAPDPDQVHAALVKDYQFRPVRREVVEQLAEHAALAEMSAEFAGWHIWRSSGRRWWATRRGNIPPGRKRDSRWSMTVDADTPDELRKAIQLQQVIT